MAPSATAADGLVVSSPWRQGAGRVHDPGLFEFLKRPDKLTIVEFPISTDSGEVINFEGTGASIAVAEAPARVASDTTPTLRRTKLELSL